MEEDSDEDMPDLKQKPEAKFKYHAKYIFLTYANAAGLNKLMIEAGLKHWGAVMYVIGEEIHESGEPHFHVVAKWAKKIKTTNCRYWDIHSDDHVYHPNVRVNSSKKMSGATWFCKMEEYATKEDRDPLYSHKRNMPVISTGYKKWKEDHETWARDRYFQKLKSIGEFQLPTGYTVEIPNEPQRRGLIILHGEPGCGKTRWLETTFEGFKVWKRGTGDYPYERYPDECRIIVWDDIKCEKKEKDTLAEEIISILNYYKTDTPVWGKSRFNPTYWPKKQQRLIIWLMNTEYMESEFWWKPVLEQPRIRDRILHTVHMIAERAPEDSDAEI